ncbi:MULTISPECIES: protein transport protein HofC [Buttiauxella]|jgi:protein transport protein HofC|uniref:protein transport protein HofC n=1 Tax=Buttiauxella TaxID=82976 RepID=UPI001E2CBB31|nr:MULTISPECIES: protein transport protein HofC [Buttiauxella]MCE0826467.1 protein transport protein HofC [Buttiauxella ferragutiae]UNK60636.1 protein transport protein HofC [Buttiauxella ferragutiae]
MAKFLLWRWKAIDQFGQVQKGAVLAEDATSVTDQLFNADLQLLHLRKTSHTRRGCWNIQQKIQVFRQLATLLQAGISLSDGLVLIAQQHPFEEWRALLKDIEQRVSNGTPFSAALRQWPKIFPALFIALIHIGELTGKLDECCKRLADQQEKLYQLRKKVMKALRYPLFIIVVALLVTIGMMSFVLPEFANIYRSFNAPLPAITAMVMAVSNWVTTQGLRWLLAFVILFACGYFLRRRKPHWQEYEQNLLLHIPLIAPLWRGQILSQIYTTLSLSQQAGIPLLQGLEAVETTLTPLLWKKVISQISAKVIQGVPFWHALNESERFTALCCQLVRVGEESGSLDLMLEKLASWHHNNTEELADNLAAALEPIMMIVVGIIIGTLVIAMYLPIFQLGDAMSAG